MFDEGRNRKGLPRFQRKRRIARGSLDWFVNLLDRRSCPSTSWEREYWTIPSDVFRWNRVEDPRHRRDFNWTSLDQGKDHSSKALRNADDLLLFFDPQSNLELRSDGSVDQLVSALLDVRSLTLSSMIRPFFLTKRAMVSQILSRTNHELKRGFLTNTLNGETKRICKWRI